MKKIIIALLVFMANNATFAQLKNNITKSKITFEIKNLGFKTGGGIEKMEAEIKFDPDNLAASKIEAAADVTTINTGNNARDKHLKSEDYFDVAKFPKITMSSVSFKKKSSNNFAGQFNISIKGKTQLVELPFTYTEVNGVSSFKGSFKINRRDFGVGGNSMTLSNEATILIAAESTK